MSQKYCRAVRAVLLKRFDIAELVTPHFIAYLIRDCLQRSFCDILLMQEACTSVSGFVVKLLYSMDRLPTFVLCFLVYLH